MDSTMSKSLLRSVEPYSESSLQPFGKLILADGRTDLRDFQGRALRSLLKKEKLILFRGFNPLQKKELMEFAASSQRDFLEWNFGPVMEMKPDRDPKNYLFSREAVPFHWDGAFHRTPSFLIFQCVSSPQAESGGETLFTDTHRIWTDTKAELKDIWQKVSLTYSTEKLAHYGGSFTTALIETHPERGEVILRFAEPVETKLNPVTLEIHGLSKTLSELFFRDLVRKIYSPKYCYAHSWEEGDILIADNHSLLHGRNAFDTETQRHLRRIQLL